MTIVTLLISLLLVVCGVYVAYLAIFAFAGILVPAKKYSSSDRKSRFAVFLPAYKEDGVILNSTKKALEQNYPKELFDVIVIADSMKPETIGLLNQLPVKTIVVSFELSSKSKALNFAMNTLDDASYDIALILDADNIMEDDFLDKINAAFQNGWSIVQGHRTAKNTNTTTAVLDAISEESNNHIFNKGHRALGLSSRLLGSGMAFDYQLFKDTMIKIDTLGGFDKELEMRLLKKKYTFEYLDDALVYDEKVQNPEVFEKQRTRWIAAQLKYLKSNFVSGFVHLFKGNIDYFNKVFQAMMLPRIILLGLLFILVPVTILLKNYQQAIVTLSLISALAIVFFISIPGWLKKQIGWREMLLLPKLFFKFLKSITKIGDANKKFIHTPHDTTH